MRNKWVGLLQCALNCRLQKLKAKSGMHSRLEVYNKTKALNAFLTICGGWWVEISILLFQPSIKPLIQPSINWLHSVLWVWWTLIKSQYFCHVLLVVFLNWVLSVHCNSQGHKGVHSLRSPWCAETEIQPQAIIETSQDCVRKIHQCDDHFKAIRGPIHNGWHKSSPLWSALFFPPN